MPTPSAASHEPHPDPSILTTSTPPSDSSSPKVSYAPNPQKSLPISPRRSTILNAITSLYSGSASAEDMLVYATDAVYDDPLSYCDSRYKIAGQWYGIPMLFASSKTLGTEVVKSTGEGKGDEKRELVFKLRQEYTLKGGVGTKVVDSLVSLGLAIEDDGKGEKGEEVVKYHKDMWNEKDYSHQGIGFWFKKMNGDYLTGITQPPSDL